MHRLVNDNSPRSGFLNDLDELFRERAAALLSADQEARFKLWKARERVGGARGANGQLPHPSDRRRVLDCFISLSGPDLLRPAGNGDFRVLETT